MSDVHQQQRVITLPELSLILLVGASGSGKSSFARKHFEPTEIVSSDVCRGMVSDDENDQSATKPAFELLHTIVEKRLQLGRLTVVDATNVRREDRQPLIQLARRFHVLPVAIVLDLPAPGVSRAQPPAPRPPVWSAGRRTAAPRAEARPRRP